MIEIILAVGLSFLATVIAEPHFIQFENETVRTNDFR